MVLEGRHVLGLFLLIVVISGIVFTLGYILGRNQYETQVRAAELGPRTSSRAANETAPSPKASSGRGNSSVPAPAASDWDFYKSAETKPEAHLEKPPKPVDVVANKQSAKTLAAAPGAPAEKPLMNTPLVPKGAIVLQVAAFMQESDALAIAESLQKKKFPTFVLMPPSGDRYYRVQVGPYADAQSANLARKALEREGFKAIVKR